MATSEVVKLAKKAKRGNKAAFDQLCDIKLKQIVFNAYGILGNMQDAEDVAQETLVSMYKNIKKLRNPKVIDAWIMRIVRNHSNEVLKHNIPRKTELDVDTEQVVNVLLEEGREFLPEAYLDDQVLSDELFKIVMELPDKRREIVIMYYYDDLSYQEISDLTGLSINTVSTNLFRAKKTIKDAIDKKAALQGYEIVDQSQIQSQLSSKLAVGVAAIPVLTQLLKQQETLLVQPQALLAIKEAVAQATIGVPLATGLSALFAKTSNVVATVALTTTVAGGGATYVAISQSDAQQTTAVVAQPEETQIVYKTVSYYPADEGGVIEFVVSPTAPSGAAQHTNPSQILLLGNNAPGSNVTWQVYKSANNSIENPDFSGEPLIQGSGNLVTTELEEFISTALPGTYVFVFTVTDNNYTKLIKARAFTVEAVEVVDVNEVIDTVDAVDIIDAVDATDTVDIVDTVDTIDDTEDTKAATTSD